MPQVIERAQAALATPFAGFGEYEVFPALHEKAALYCSRIIALRPLPDGNEHTAYDVMREFVERNGATFTHPPGGPDETAETLESLATGALDEQGFMLWVLQRIQVRQAR
jgi:prophage maintenance system killer protein